jgi:hypothetical protein
MAKNLGRKYATMSEDERRQFALQEDEGNEELASELDFEEPRQQEGPQFSSLGEEIRDPEHRDGLGSQLDDAQHEQAVKNQGRRQESSNQE